jgi:hypothetical protein
MKNIIDVVNFNADASCLSSSRWLEMLRGGESSILVHWLRLYADMGKKVTLGFPGGTVADIAVHNPEAISLINSRPDIYEIILRPFAHDIALLRVQNGFAVNFFCGQKVIEREFKYCTRWFLPPEFMLTNGQLTYLVKEGIDGIFINPARFSSEIRERIPDMPYKIKGLFGSYSNGLPFHGRLTDAYLHTLQKFNCRSWNNAVNEEREEILYSWRDGESPFLLPDSLNREGHWLEQESTSISRAHLRDLDITFTSAENLDEHNYRSYPVHPFTMWMKEFRMLGFIGRIAGIEQGLQQLTDEQIILWLSVINSDIMSAVEKKSPVVDIAARPENSKLNKHIIRRSERGFEGEEYLAVLENSLALGTVPNHVFASSDPHMIKLCGRIGYLKQLKIDLRRLFPSSN